MQHASSFDSDLQMVGEAPGSVNMAYLCFLRWLLEQGRLEHPPAGPACGELADRSTNDMPPPADVRGRASNEPWR
jgi:hypothetical protein